MNNIVKVDMIPNSFGIKTLSCSHGDTEREFKFTLNDGDGTIDTSDVEIPLPQFPVYEGGTEEILPVNESVPLTAPIIADIQYPQGLLNDQEFLYRESPSEEDGFAKPKSIKGNTLGWNQQLLAPTTSGATTSSADGSFRSNRCTFTYDSATHIITITSLENVGTSGFVFGLANGAPLIVGHKYLQMCDVQAPKVFNFVIGTNDNADAKTNLPANTYHRVSTIKEFSSSSNEIRFNFNNSNGWAGTETVYIKNAMLFDLTQMVLDISSPSEFPFSLPYYDYNQGTLIPFSGNGIKTTGKNLLQNNVSSKTENGVTFTVNEDGTVTVNGTATGGNSNLSIPSGLYLRKGNYFISGCPSGGSSSTYSWMIVTKYNGQWIQDFGDGRAFTMAEDGYCDVYFARVINGATANNLTFKPMVTFQGVDQTFEPYTETITDLPISTYFPTGMKRAGNAYDELTESKAITRIGTVDLGSLTWTKVSGYPEYRAQFANNPNLDIKHYGNILCAYYETLTLSETYRGNNRGISIGDTYISVGDSTLADLNAFLSAVSGVYLYYELATETETEIASASLVTENGEIQLSPQDGYLVGTVNSSISEKSGMFDAKVKLTDGDGTVYSNKLELYVERRPQ